MSQSTDIIDQLSEEAKAVLAKLEILWQDEGVVQLELFLDPAIYVVLKEIRETSMDFIARVAALSD